MSTSEVAKRYFAALDAHDVDAAVACWKPGGIDRFVGEQDVVAPDGVRDYFAALFDAFPDFRLEVIEVTAYRGRAAVRWRATGTFAGPGRFQGLEPNGARVALEGCDVVLVEDEKITHNDAYTNTGDIARQLGFLPAAGSRAETRLTSLANVRTRITSRLAASRPELIADGVWLVRGGFPRTMNVYLLEDEGGVTMFDAGVASMSRALAAAGARLGGIKRIVLGHADADHRGAAPALDAPVFVHPADREAAESDSSFRDYFDFDQLDRHGRALLPRLLRVWDGGAVSVAGTVNEGDLVAGFEVVHLPGHAPGLIGLYRKSDRVALVSDCVYTLDPQTGIKGGARVPLSAFNIDTEQARASIRKLAALEPSIAWAGHADPVTGDVRGALERAASA